MMKKVLITGADGFIGSHLCEYLINKNIKVIALVQYNSFDSWGWLDSIKTNKENFKSSPVEEKTDIPEQIKKLSDLKDQGILTEEEFQSKKKDLLDKM